MKKLFLLCSFVVLFTSCSEDEVVYQSALIPIDDAIVPTSFTLNASETVTLRYTLPNDCYRSPKLFYRYEGTSRIIAIQTLKNIQDPCSQATIPQELEFTIHVLQSEDYILRFLKGWGGAGEYIYEDLIVSVD